MVELVTSDDSVDVGENPLDAFHKHEVVHASSMVNKMFDDHIYESRLVQADPVLLKAAEEVYEKLADFYQLVNNSEVGEGTVLMPEKITDKIREAVLKSDPKCGDQLDEIYEVAIKAGQV